MPNYSASCGSMQQLQRFSDSSDLLSNLLTSLHSMCFSASVKSAFAKGSNSHLSSISYASG